MPELAAGDIGVVAKLAHTATGDTLCAKERQFTLPANRVPEPGVQHGGAARHRRRPSISSARASSGWSKRTRACGSRATPAPAEIILSGLGDAHLDVTVERLKRKFNVDVELALPRVPYRETIAQEGDGGLHPQEADRRPRPVRARRDRSEPAAARLRAAVHREGGRWRGAEGVHPGGREGHP